MIVPNICKDEQNKNFTKLFVLRVSISLRRRTIILDVIMMLDFNFHAIITKIKMLSKKCQQHIFLWIFLNANLCPVQKKKSKTQKWKEDKAIFLPKYNQTAYMRQDFCNSDIDTWT